MAFYIDDKGEIDISSDESESSTGGFRFSVDNADEDKIQSQEEEQSPPMKGNSLIKQLLKEYKSGNLGTASSITNNNEIKAKDNKDTKKKEDMLLGKVLKEMESKGKNHKRKKPLVIESDSAKEEVKKVLKKSVITPDFENLHTVPPYEVSERRAKIERKKQSEKTKGKKWFGLPATEMTDEVKRDLEVIQMRSVLDPKHFYKKNDLKVLPKYFQVGKVMDAPLDFYNDRLTKKERKKTLVDELMADFEFKKYNKRKYKEIIEEKQKTHYKAWKQAKRLKKRKS